MKLRPTTPCRGQSKNPQPLSALELDNALLRIEVVVQATGTSTSTVRRKVADGTFPEPVKLGSRCTRWLSSDIRKWIQSQVLESLAASAGKAITSLPAAGCTQPLKAKKTRVPTQDEAK